MKIALIFPGQGSQTKGMGKEILDQFARGFEILSEASSILGYDLEKLIKDDPDNLLNQTKYTQPALYVISCIYMEYLKERDLKWYAVAGHSLGEYSALFAAGIYSFSQGLKLVAKRGDLMGKINDDSLGMGAVIGLSGEETLSAASQFPQLYIANLNAPEQTVVSGKKDSLDSLGKYLKEEGKGRLIPLKVKGAFHSPFMKPVEEEFIKAADSLIFKNAEVDVYPNVLATKTREGNKLKACLVEQISGQVRWTDTVKTMENDGITGYVEVGPGKVLAGLMKKCSPIIKAVEI